MKRQSVFIASLAALLAWAPAQSQEFKFATQNPKGHPLVTGMERFAEIVAARSGGKIKVNLFPGGVLGSDQANVSALQGGTLEMVVLNSGILASQVKEFGIYDFPFMFASPKEADAVVDGPFGKMMHDKLEAKGIVGLAPSTSSGSRRSAPTRRRFPFPRSMPRSTRRRSTGRRTRRRSSAPTSSTRCKSTSC